MIATIAIDLEVLGSIAAGRADGLVASPAVHRFFVDELRDRGVLVLTSQSELDRLIELLRRVPQPIRKIWESALSSQVQIHHVMEPPLDRSVAEIDDYDELARMLSNHADVALVEPVRGHLFLGIEDGEVSHDEGPIEVTRFDHAAASTRMHRPFTPVFGAGTSRDSFFDVMFRPLLEATTTVTVLDSYVGKNLAAWKSEAAPGDNKPKGRTHLGTKWFLERLHTSGASKLHLRLIGSQREVRNPSDAFEAVNWVADNLGGGCVKSIELCLAPKVDHSRHVRFERFAIQVDKGLDTFTDAKAQQSYPLGLLEPSIARDKERRSRQRGEERRAYLT